MVIKSRTMKRILYLFIAAIFMASCSNKQTETGTTELTLEEKLIGEWHSTALAVKGDIYLSFKGTGKTFELYQQIGEGAYRFYCGQWNLEEGILTGKYNDGEDWHTAYRITIEDSRLTMVSQNDTAEQSTFEGCQIPESVKEHCVPAVKSDEESPIL